MSSSVVNLEPGKSHVKHATGAQQTPGSSSGDILLLTVLCLQASPGPHGLPFDLYITTISPRPFQRERKAGKNGGGPQP